MVFEKHYVEGDHRTLNLVIFITSSIIVIGIYIPLLCFYLCKFYRIRNAAFLKHRFPILTLKAVISIVFILFFGSFYGFLGINGLDHIGLLILILFMMLPGSAFCHCIMLRVWLLYFTVRYNKAISNDVWQSIINPYRNTQETEVSGCDNPNAWFIHHKATYGNYEWMTKKLRKAIIVDFSFAIVCFLIIGLCTKLSGNETITHILFIIFVVVSFLYMFAAPLAVISLIYKHIPEFYDNLHLREELVFLSRLFVVCLPVFLVILIAFILDQFQTLDNREGKESLWKIIGLTIDWQITAFILLYVARRMVYVYPNTLKQMQQVPESSETRTTQRSVALSEYKPMENVTATKSKRIKMRDVLKHEQCFEVFIEHLAYEYCMESLLSIIEFTHFRDYILLHEPQLKQMYDNKQAHQSMHSDSMRSSTMETPSPLSPSITTDTSDINILTDAIIMYYELPQGIVKSDIVYPKLYTDASPHKCGEDVNVKMEEYLTKIKHKMKDKEERIKAYKQMAYAIYDKYIRTGAEYEINISYDVRRQYILMMSAQQVWINEMEDFDETKLFCLFDDCYKEMDRLLQHIWWRFKPTNKFDQITEVLQTDS